MRQCQHLEDIDDVNRDGREEKRSGKTIRKQSLFRHGDFICYTKID